MLAAAALLAILAASASSSPVHAAVRMENYVSYTGMTCNGTELKAWPTFPSGVCVAFSGGRSIKQTCGVGTTYHDSSTCQGTNITTTTTDTSCNQWLTTSFSYGCKTYEKGAAKVTLYKQSCAAVAALGEEEDESSATLNTIVLASYLPIDVCQGAITNTGYAMQSASAAQKSYKLTRTSSSTSGELKLEYFENEDCSGAAHAALRAQDKTCTAFAAGVNIDPELVAIKLEFVDGLLSKPSAAVVQQSTGVLAAAAALVVVAAM